MLGIASAIVQGIDDYIKLRKINEWLKLTWSVGFSAGTSFLFVCGSSLMSKMSFGFSIGSGMVASAVSMMIVFRRSPLTKGMIVALPPGEALKEMNSNAEVTSK